MEHVIPSGNWTTYLADAIEAAADGDTIVVDGAELKDLAQETIQQMRPELNVQLVVRPLPVPFR